MKHARRQGRPGTLVVLLLVGMSTGAGVAQEAPEHPADEPHMLEVPDTDSPKLAASNALREGQNALRSALRAREKATHAEGKKREKLEASTQQYFDSATQSFLIAIQLDKELVGAYMGLGETWLETGQPDKALQAWGAAQKRAPKDPRALFGLGRSLVALDRPHDAASVYLGLAEVDKQRAAELLELLRAWGEPRAAEGNEEARGLLGWIAQQAPG